MITTVNTAAALSSALAAAKAGDTLQLAGGTYASLNISGLNFARDVTITSVDAAAPAIIKAMTVTSSSGLTFTGLTFDSTGATTGQPFIVSDSRDVHFANVSVHGSMDGNPHNDGAGLYFRRDTDVGVSDSEFQQLSQGIQHANDSGLAITNNRFHDISTDGVMGGGSSNVVISANSFRDFSPVSGDHPDAIQFYTSGTTAAAHDITIVNNQIQRGSGSAIQGIFMRDEVGSLAYSHVNISGNLVSGTSYHGISVLHGTDINITRNIVQGFSDMKSWILEQNVTTAQITDNAANEIVDWGGSSDDVWARNTTLALAKDGGAAVLQSWLTTTAADSQVLAGTTANSTLLGGKGADTVSDTGGANLLRGDDGADSVSGGAGYDDAAGGAGNDTVDGRAGDDWVRGGDGDDRVLGGDGDDMAYGDAGNDTVDGGLGSDVVRGGLGGDLLIGGDGADWLLGDGGNDTLTGGLGADTFVSYGAGGVDRVTDFHAWEGDRIQLAAGSSWSAAQVGADTVVSIAGGAQVVLANVVLSQLQPGWIFTG